MTNTLNLYTVMYVQKNDKSDMKLKTSFQTCCLYILPLCTSRDLDSALEDAESSPHSELNEDLWTGCTLYTSPEQVAYPSSYPISNDDDDDNHVIMCQSGLISH